jgi:hypothetical protein
MRKPRAPARDLFSLYTPVTQVANAPQRKRTGTIHRKRLGDARLPMETRHTSGLLLRCALVSLLAVTHGSNQLAAYVTDWIRDQRIAVPSDFVVHSCGARILLSMLSTIVVFMIAPSSMFDAKRWIPNREAAIWGVTYLAVTLLMLVNTSLYMLRSEAFVGQIGTMLPLASSAALIVSMVYATGSRGWRPARIVWLVLLAASEWFSLAMASGSIF